MHRIVSFLLLVSAALAADAIYINGTVITVDPSKPYAEAFAVTNGRFSAVGSTAEIRRLATPTTKIVDLKGMTVTPGFNDVHLHPAGVYDEDSPYYTPWLGPEKVHNMDELIAALKAKADKTPPGQLVSGTRYQDTKLGRHPTRYDLDKASTMHPISISHSSGHITVVNSYILNASGITKDTKDPPGGSFDRDPDGTPNGVIRESARRLLRRVSTGERTAHSVGSRSWKAIYAASASTPSAASPAPESPAAARKRSACTKPCAMPEARFAWASCIWRRSYPALQAIGLKSGFGDDRLRFTSIKVFHGNSMSGRTCWLSEQYSDQPGYFGIPPARSQADLDKAFQAMHDAGFQIATHSNGDREIDMVLTAIERAQAKNPRPDARHRIEHASVMNQSLLERAKKAGVILVFHSYMWEHGDKLASYGEKRLAMIHPYRTAIDMGIHVAGHSDSTVSAADPLLRIQDMVTRKGENGVGYGVNQRVGVEEAIKVWTLDGAYATFEEQGQGVDHARQTGRFRGAAQRPAQGSAG